LLQPQSKVLQLYSRWCDPAATGDFIVVHINDGPFFVLLTESQLPVTGIVFSGRDLTVPNPFYCHCGPAS
jgi:hypothetical protein